MVLEPNQPVFVVQTRTAGGLPRPVANTTLGGGGRGQSEEEMAGVRVEEVGEEDIRMCESPTATTTAWSRFQ